MANLLSNSTFEAGGTGGNFDGGAEADDGTSDTFTSWTNSGVDDGNGNKVEATATKQGGSYAVKISYGTASCYTYQAATVVPGRRYKLTFYSRGDGSVGGRYAVYDVTGSAWITTATATGVTSTTYTLVTAYFVVPSNCISARIDFMSPSASGVAYFDTASLDAAFEGTAYKPSMGMRM